MSQPEKNSYVDGYVSELTGGARAACGPIADKAVLASDQAAAQPPASIEPVILDVRDLAH